MYRFSFYYLILILFFLSCDHSPTSQDNPSLISISFGSISNNYIEIIMNTSHDVGGFQMDILGTDLGVASGGLAEEAGFTVSTGGTTMLGFSFSGGFISAGSSGVLTNIHYTATDSQACLANGIISDGLGNGLDVELGGCIEY
jgi:hypothetical protein